jgi:hypothetical protein
MWSSGSFGRGHLCVVSNYSSEVLWLGSGLSGSLLQAWRVTWLDGGFAQLGVRIREKSDGKRRLIHTSLNHNSFTCAVKKLLISWITRCRYTKNRVIVNGERYVRWKSLFLNMDYLNTLNSSNLKVTTWMISLRDNKFFVTVWCLPDSRWIISRLCLIFLSGFNLTFKPPRNQIWLVRSQRCRRTLPWRPQSKYYVIST